MAKFLGEAADFVVDLVDKSVMRYCAFVNDTKYQVEVLAHDGTYCVKPRTSRSFQ